MFTYSEIRQLSVRAFVTSVSVFFFCYISTLNTQGYHYVLNSMTFKGVGARWTPSRRDLRLEGWEEIISGK